jgi:hypothetical protein
MAADNLQLMSKAGRSDEIPPPVNEKDVNRFLADVQSHPDYREVERRLKSLGEKCENRDVRNWSAHQHASNGKWTASRVRLHEGLVAKALAGRQKAPQGTRPIAVLLIGTPGSGKTSEGMKHTQHFGVDFVVINADNVKENLPEYRGWNAAALHEESSYVAEELIYKRAVVARRHLVFDLTGTDQVKMLAMVDNLDSLRYEVHVILVRIPDWVAAGRAWSRFCKVPFDKNPEMMSGRFVPPEYVYNVVDEKPARTYNLLKNHPAVKGWMAVSTAKKPARVTEKGQR